MEESKISIIVPVYKVEPYLRKCLDSIVGQTYQNLEIILVDDGSPDNCGAVCDEYAEKDRRIRVIHKENGGLSSARNTGLEVMTGDYIGFVDSDDWVERDIFEYLLLGIQRHHADIAVCGMTEVYPHSRKERGWDDEAVLDREQMIEALLGSGPLENYACGKLWHRDLFQEVRFPIGCSYEDIATTYRLFKKAEKLVCLPRCKYFYLQRSDSIVGGHSLKTELDYYEMSWKRYEDLKEEWPQFESLLRTQCVNAAIGLWAGYYRNPKKERENSRERIRAVSIFVRRYGWETMKDMGLGLAGRLILRLASYPRPWAFALAWLIGELYEKKHGRML